MNDDLGAAILFQRHEALHRFLALLASQGGVNFGNLALEAPFEEILGFDQLPQPLGFPRVRCDDENERQTFGAPMAMIAIHSTATWSW